MLEQSEDVLKYKNFWLFYTNLYERLFKLINDIVDENQFDVKLLKDKLLDFLDTYSYYIIDKKILTREEIKTNKVETDKDILQTLKSFDSFTENLKQFPSKEFTNIRIELIKNNYNLSKLSDKDYSTFIKEYYLFFDETIKILKIFIEIASVNGFLPNIKSKNSLSTIGYANYDYFFKELEGLKVKMSEVTTTLKITNLFKCRRCIYSILVIFSPYFKRKKLFNSLAEELNFKFLEDDELIKDLKRGYNYEAFIYMPKHLQDSLANNIIIPLKSNISLIKRYMSYEFGEVDMSPRIKKKYGFDPTWT